MRIIFGRGLSPAPHQASPPVVVGLVGGGAGQGSGGGAGQGSGGGAGQGSEYGLEMAVKRAACEIVLKW